MFINQELRTVALRHIKSDIIYDMIFILNPLIVAVVALVRNIIGFLWKLE